MVIFFVIKLLVTKFKDPDVVVTEDGKKVDVSRNYFWIIKDVKEHSGDWTNHATPDMEEHIDKCVGEPEEPPSLERAELDLNVIR